MMARQDEPAILTRLIGQLIDKGHSPETARRIAFKSLQASGNLEPGSIRATDQGHERGLMTPKERAIDREVRRSGKSPDLYSYSSTTNRATLKKGKVGMGKIDDDFSGF